MKFNEFLKRYDKVQVIDSSTFALLPQKLRDIRRQVRFWVEKGYLIPLKKGSYIFNETFRKVPLSYSFIANYLISPSYLSLEYALGFYGLIPEKVTVFTSVTPKKTLSIKNPLGVFEYRSLKKELFFGFVSRVDNEQPFFIALPEKALLDYFYLSKKLRGVDKEFESLRLQNLEIVNIKRLNEFKSRYGSRTREIANSFISFVRQYKKEYRDLK